MLNDSKERDQLVLVALDENMKKSPTLGVCADTFYALKQEFLRVMRERDDAISALEAFRREM